MNKYPKILSVGHKLLSQLFDDPVEITEKVDGSQFRINLTKDQVIWGSRNKDCTQEEMFDIAIRQAKRIWNDGDWQSFGDNITLFCEYLRTERHNTIKYNRVPRNNLYLFGAIIDGVHCESDELLRLANTLEIDPPVVISHAKIDSSDKLNNFLQTESYLGGAKIEGVVIKNYCKSYDPLLVSTQHFLGYPLAGKLVREDFREKNTKNRNTNKGTKGIDRITGIYFTKQRLHKAIQHLEEDGKIQGEKKDLKYLIPEFYDDIVSECFDEINEMIIREIWADIKRRGSNFVVKHYIEYLTKKQFDEELT